MNFISIEFLILFIVLALAFQLLALPLRKYLILFSGLLFVGFFNWQSLVCLVILSGFNFIVARNLLLRPAIYGISLVINCLSILVINLFNNPGTGKTFNVSYDPFSALLVIGLSFYSLQHIAYLVDVKKGRVVPETDFITLLLISSYFPKFLAGPLTLYQDLKPQLNYNKPTGNQLLSGFNRVLIGFFKKMVLADRLAPSVSSVFDYNDELPGLTIITAAVFFTLQVYFDFSGYCDIAIGASRMLGIELRENFYFPFRSTSVTIFWRRWHRTLIRFFTTYLFFPVTFRYRHLKKQAAAIGIILTFLISAVWHGIGFTFMMWGICHMLFLLIELYTLNSPNERQLTNKPLKILFSFLVLLAVSFSHIFFRATGYNECLHLLENLFSLRNFFPTDPAPGFFAPLAVGGHQAEYFNLSLTVLFVLFFLLFERRIHALFNAPRIHVVYSALIILLIFIFGVFNSGERFIYMQF